MTTALEFGFFDELEKIAFINKKWVKRHGLTAAALGLVAAPLVGRVVRGAKMRSDIRKTKELLKQENPEGLAKDPRFERHFRTLRKFSPVMASDPVATTTALRSMNRGRGPSVQDIAAIHDIGRNEAERRRESADIFGLAGERAMG